MTEPGSGLPLRWGKPRSFWAILGLSIITCTVYYIVYHYLVAIELKKTMRWSENESFKPSTFMLLYTALVVYSLLMGTITTVALAYLGIEAGLDKLLDLASGPLQLFSAALQVLMAGVAFYITYYFLKLNDNAAAKIGLPKRGASRATLIYGFVTAFVIVIAILGVFMDPETLKFGRLESGDLKFSNDIALILFNGFVSFLWMATALYFLWEQTSLVNYIWEQGRFAAPPGYTPARPVSAPNHPQDSPTTQIPTSDRGPQPPQPTRPPTTPEAPPPPISD